MRIGFIGAGGFECIEEYLNIFYMNNGAFRQDGPSFGARSYPIRYVLCSLYIPQ